jgi:HPt (histidine-containing phosphotransfer) domain-containing protein
MPNPLAIDDPRRPAADLDAQALAALRALDPGGGTKLVQRVARAFESSAARLVPQMHAALAAGDNAGVRHVAHTIKSSSASVGAMVLSRRCAEVEAMIRDDRIVDLGGRVAELAAEIDAALVALRRLPDAA